MPTSRPEPIPFIANKIITLKPKSILDVGIGFGKWGFLAREYTDIWLNHLQDKEGFLPTHWKFRVDGVEIYDKYITKLQDLIYDEIYIGDAIDVIPQLDRYDMIIASDILEHMNKDSGIKLINAIKDKSQYAYIVTPKNVLPQGAVYDNIAESHVVGWTIEDLSVYGTVTGHGGAHVLELTP